MFVSMSRTIGYSISFVVSANRGAGPMSIIWCTIGVSGIDAPAMRAMRGLQQPQAITRRSASRSPRVVRSFLTRPCSTSMPRTSVLAMTVNPALCARSRMIVPARSESTTPAPGVKNPPRISRSSMKGTSSFTWSGVSSSTGSMPHDFAEALGRGHPPGQLLHPLRRARPLDPAALDEHAEVLVLAHALERQRRHLLGVVDREDEVRRVSGRAAGVRERPLGAQLDVPACELGQVVGQAVADDAGAEHHRPLVLLLAGALFPGDISDGCHGPQ